MPRALKSIRWTISLAAGEFGLDQKTLSNRIKEKGILHGEDKRYSTSDICRAVFTSGNAARTALAMSQKEHFDLKNAKLAGTLVDKELMQQISDGVILELRQKVSDSDIPEAAKTALLKDIQNINIDELVSNNSKSHNPDLEDESEAG